MKLVGTSDHKNLIVTYKSWDGLADRLRGNIELIRDLNPGWRLCFFDDAKIEEFILREYGGSVLDLYRSVNPTYGAARADLFRYLSLNKLGGVYIDAKTRVVRPFDSWIRPEDDFILSQWSSQHVKADPGAGKHRRIAHVVGGEFINWFLYSRPGHPLLEQAITFVLRRVRRYSPFLDGVGKGAVLCTTGPVALTLAIHPHLNRYSFRLVEDLSAHGIEYSIDPASEHENLFPMHYSRSRQPLTSIGKIHWRSFCFLRHIKRKFSAF